MGHPEKAKKVVWITLLVAAAFAALVILIPDAPGRLLGFALEIAWYFVFPRIQNDEFNQWQAAHPDVLPSSGWKTLGWGFIGFALFLVIFFGMALLLVHS
jgi:hypothetical protein